ncbi:penicillin-binding protein 1C [Pseudobacter ginsenosidimutans]|uniref:peptidoglycan glycosyltransferase n=1 Tax=Pseudobacter ginsenosidimutans TaxID=661488 RepID=A0A4Q7MQD8_9BACT|nr:penicillin-binding protein 1C [Pseudobacter ginsenosidimutans]QEC40364.1 penicillin-binding protein 1C [Pseudobacter ginsenosidimutans]RZS69032.1 penicillin-binding protein 1C [Pseudobacter ginsenosidimutans]
MKQKLSNRLVKWSKRLVLTGIAVFLLFLLLNWIFPVPDNVDYSTIITDNKGEVIHAYLTKDQQWRMKTELDEISPLLRKTIVEKEDKYFYYHPGVNGAAILRAMAKNVFRLKRTSGASTITMQVARALEPKRRTYFNKFIEMFRAFQLEWKYSKDEILQLYLNLVPYGGNLQGVKSASTLYFKKNPDHLSLAEITALSIIPNRPSSLVMGRNNDKIVEERNRWLRKFAADNVFTEKEIRDALEEPLTATRGEAPKLAPHLAYQLQKSGHDIIETNIELNTQMKIEKIVEDYSRSLTLKNIRNAAVVIIDNHTHNVITYVGSANFYDTTDGGQVNGARAIRQPGSTLKPLLYGMCIDEGLLTPKAVITDVAVNYGGYAPENYDKQFNGFVTMEYALEHSLNIPAVKGLEWLGKDKFIQTLAGCDFQQIRKDQKKLGLSLILGGCGSNLEELTGLYTIFANNGKYIRPNYTKRDSTQAAFTRNVLSPASTFMINETLSKVNRPDFPLNWQSTERMPKIAWKTGTSYGRRDAWSIGYNKNYTVGVWVGNFSALGIPELSGANVATPLLFRIFNTIDYDSDQEWFKQPDDCDIRMVCSETGLPPADHCSSTVTDYFIPLISGTQSCNNQEELAISPDEKISYCKTCQPQAGYKKKWYKIVSAEMQHYFEEHHIRYAQIPPHNPNCERLFAGGAPVITFPKNGAEYLISKKHPEPLQLTCNVGNDVGKVFWYINDQFYKSTDAKSKQFFVPDEGPVKISCTDDKGRNRNIWIRVKYVNL